MHATLTARGFFLANFYPSGPFTCIFPKPLPRFSKTFPGLCRPAEQNRSPCLMQVPVLNTFIYYSFLSFLSSSLVAPFSSLLFSVSSFFLLLTVFFFLSDEDTNVSARLYFSHSLSSIGEFIFRVFFLTCLPHQQLLAFSSVFDWKFRNKLICHIIAKFTSNRVVALASSVPVVVVLIEES